MSSSKSASTAVIIGAVVALVIGAGALFVLSFFKPATTLHIGDGVFTAEVAYTQASRERGLGGVNALDADKAMILAFPSDGQWPIWMKDMRTSIDIIWLDADKKVVYIVKNVSPDSGTDVMYTPKVDARYVVELAAGTVEKQHIVVGRAAVFDIKNSEVQ